MSTYRYSRNDLDQYTIHNSCLCSPWKKTCASGSSGELRDYTDAELAAEMNALTFEERQAMEADIHGVSDIIKETPEFLKEHISQMQEELSKLNPRRQAWDRAVFLRPSLAEDQRLYIMCLRARRFRPHDSALLLAAYFRAKLDLFGDELLIHRITWNDLTEHEHNLFRSGAYEFLPNRDQAGRAVIMIRQSHHDLSDFKAMARCIWYTDSGVEEEQDIQRRGVVTVLDITDAWKFSIFQALHFASNYPIDSTPFHDVSLHILYNDVTLDSMIRRRRPVLLNHRLRIRMHFGSTLEIQYSLKTFGIDVSRQSCAPKDDNNLLQLGGIDESIRRRQQLDEQWLLSEAAYRDPSSPTACFPNPQDIIMGRHKAIMISWNSFKVVSGMSKHKPFWTFQ